MRTKPELTLLGSATTLVLRSGTGTKVNPGGDNQCTDPVDCSASECDD